MTTSRFVHRHADLDAALKRLAGALDQLEAAAARFDRAEAERRDAGDALAAIEDDRGRLADELDAALARTRALEGAACEVAGRLAAAGVALRRYLAAADGALAEGFAP